MSDATLLDCVDALPSPADPRRGEEALADLRRALEGTAEAALAGSSAFATLAMSLAGNSGFLARTCLRRPSLLAELATEQPDAAFDRAMKELEQAAAAAERFEDLMKGVREAKSVMAVRTAAADLTGLWPLETVTTNLTRFADTVLTAGLDWLLKRAVTKGDITDPDMTAAKSGLVILAMGKYGSGELNYSSDIDLVVFYEPGVVPLRPNLDEASFFVRITKDIVKLMQERTADGYVFRTDLRLRPDPGGTQVAVSLPAAEHYYEARGQNWERAAFIKARPAAGDLDAGKRFIDMLAPFIWRKYLDYAAIEDIHSMKRQIHAVGGHGKIAVAGHNIKLGRGGIREIEFFVQTQQLIAGGREPELRGMQTCPMLDMLAERDWIEPQVAEDLKAAYRFLRTLEHRLQMIDDEQTHALPASDEGLEHVAVFMGYEDRASFETDLVAHLTRVQTHYMALFESAPPLGEEGGSLVFTGTDDDPETIETLAQLGFEKPAEVARTIREWHTGRFAATRSPRSRERLTALMPELLRALSRTADPDIAFVRFDQFLSGLPAGVQLFSLLYANPGLLNLIAGICGTAPRLATYLSQNAGVLDAVLSSDFFTRLPGEEELEEDLAAALEPARDYQDVLDFARIWAREQRFRLGVRVLSASANAREAGPAYSAVAAVLIRQLYPHVVDEVAIRHGIVPDGEMAVVAMGKLGSGEMSAASDLDIIAIYETEDPDAASNGKKPLSASQYYARVTQQLVSALTVPTAEGKLYEVDLRLRPSGNAGPVATKLSSFQTYQAGEAWTWEHMALTRARVISGPPAIADKVEAAIREALIRERDPAKVAADVVDMRGRIEKEFPSSDPWEMKHVRGGLIDLEFIAQYLQLAHAHDHPDILTPETRAVFERAAALGLLAPETAAELISAFDLQHDLTQVVRICVTGVLKPETATEGLKRRLAEGGQAPDFAVLEASLREAQQEVLAHFRDLVGTQPPA
ncbi:MAG: bifunctional [glutamine synthetase] adenylyltransferase/[glutamine synthetase]-adenylyl-L-tyrosine phosphorylase [Parvibaculaceae bacterium]